MIGRLARAILDLWEDDPSVDELRYDPVHVAGVVVFCLLAVGILFWDLWALLVFEGGLFTKVIPFLQVVFTSKTLSDFGYEGYPYALGVFEGWIVNLGALLFSGAIVAGVYQVAFFPKKK